MILLFGEYCTGVDFKGRFRLAFLRRMQDARMSALAGLGRKRNG